MKRMYDVVLFGGTEEGRLLAEFLTQTPLRACVCVATEYGTSLLTQSPNLTIHQARLDAEKMEAFLRDSAPKLVLDATHPYAAVVSENIRTVCSALSLKLLRIVRPRESLDGCRCFETMESLLLYLNSHDEMIFSTTGAKEMKELTKIRNYQDRVWLRMLPSPAPLEEVLGMGYPAKHLICMQGPFSADLNEAMFRASGCRVLLTKESGAAGGFSEKVAAARKLGMEVCILLRPTVETGIDLQTAKQKITELIK